MKISKLLILLTFFGGIALGQESVPIEKNDGVITNVLTSFVFYDNYDELWDALPEYHGQIEGISFCLREVEVNMAWCTIHLVEPETIDGEHTLTLGHEVEHGIWGVNFHAWTLEKQDLGGAE